MRDISDRSETRGSLLPFIILHVFVLSQPIALEKARIDGYLSYTIPRNVFAILSPPLLSSLFCDDYIIARLLYCVNIFVTILLKK